MPIAGCIFDLGNTLMSIPREADEEECLARRLGFDDVDVIRTVIYRICDRYPGQPADDFLARFDSAVNPTQNSTTTTDLRRIWDESIAAARLTPGALDLLDDLRDRGIRLVLVSNTPPTSHAILDRLDLRRRFDHVVFSCDVGFLKPDPRIFRIALDALRTSPEETLVIGDKVRTDILGGAILKMKTILVENRASHVVEDGRCYVDAIVPSVAQVLETSLLAGRA